MPALDLSALNLPERHLHTLQAHEGSDLDLVLRHPIDLNQDVQG